MERVEREVIHSEAKDMYHIKSFPDLCYNRGMPKEAHYENGFND